MNLLIDSFWRAAMYCLMPRVIGLSLLPLLITVGLSGFWGYMYWDGAVQQVQRWLEVFSWLEGVWRWLDGVGFANLKTVVAPLMVIFTVTPLVVVISLLVVSLFMTPALTRLVMGRRFAHMQRKQGANWLSSLAWSLGSVVLALVAFVLTMPLWLVPPLAMLVPALIWGWLTYRVMAFDVLAEFASQQERHTMMARHRMGLLAMGVITGLMGAAPSLVWASGALFAAAFVILIPVAIWIYTLVFAFSSLWFAHFALAALHALRSEADGEAVDVTATTVTPSLHAEQRLASEHDHPEHRSPS
jgi:Etoposide-induced protein 2.4 (EI24)